MKGNRTRWIVVWAIGLGTAMGYYLMIPDQLFNQPYATLLEDRNGNLLSASIASDGQWRFPPLDSVPEKFAEAIIHFEDKRYYQHPGVDLLALGRAMRQNVQAGKVISGGSTITMQVARLSRVKAPRTYLQKVYELILATRLEWSYSKHEILALYASHAPFGGNVVGLEAACWRYFGRRLDELSWAEAALLAVLPNSPALIHPGRNRNALVQKRNRLLRELHLAGKLDAVELALATAEPLPELPQRLPRMASHLLVRSMSEGFQQQRIRTTVDAGWQERVEQFVQLHHERLRGNQIFNVAVVVAEVPTGNVVAYVGNASALPREHGGEVDVITAPRSSGSILKPFLFAAMLEEGRIMPTTLLPDVPTLIQGFAPQNFSKTYEGAVPANEALVRSLNVPAVHLLKEYRYEKFHRLLQQVGVTTLHYPADHYGLSLILGGAETTLWDITGSYASMARQVLSRSAKPQFFSLNYVSVFDSEVTRTNPQVSKAVLFQTLEALTEVNRPGEEVVWKKFTHAQKVAWKTGTSFGHRDGWAVGVTPQFAVGVWVGNADGEGRPGLTGADAAAPLMFDIFSFLPSSGWFEAPHEEMKKITRCATSGMRFSEHCPVADTAWVAPSALESPPCAYHKVVHVSRNLQYRVNQDCYPGKEIQSQPWFVLPAVQEYYYRKAHPLFNPLPPVWPGCGTATHLAHMDLVYPKPNARIYIPTALDGTPGKSVFEVAHRHPERKVYWHLDDQYLGLTSGNHVLALNPTRGKHTLVVVDEAGEALEAHFEVLSDR